MVTIGGHKYEHPQFSSLNSEWRKWRLAYGGGRDFIVEYLVHHSTRETSSDFASRKQMTYSPSHSKAAVNKVKNSIYQRMPDIIRRSDSITYSKSVGGEYGGVDNLGSSMNYFMGCIVLPELLVMGKVGVYVDMPVVNTPTMYGSENLRPYLYSYTREQIVNWTVNNLGQLTSLLLQDSKFENDPKFGFPVDYCSSYRYYELVVDGVLCTIVDDQMQTLEEPTLLKLNRIPFVIFELTDSLMKDIADYQIALLNIESSDISYIMRANYPFYVEQFDPNVEAMLMNMSRGNGSAANEGTSDLAKLATNNEIKIGPTKGRRIAKGLDMPTFIHPSSEPLKASIDKQESIKSDILKLLNLSLSNIKSNRSSAESKQQDQSDEECGLSYIGLELEAGERIITDIWQQYEMIKTSPFVQYPESYELRTFGESLGLAKEIAELIPFMPSYTGRREMARMMTKTVLGGRVIGDTYTTIETEIDNAKAIISDPSTISKDVEDGLCTRELGSVLKGYPEGEAEKAKQEHADRLALIATSQGAGKLDNPAARGLPDMAGSSAEANVEKLGKEGRGKAK